jgi:quercetin dioxygenase-like cupin family protein
METRGNLLKAAYESAPGGPVVLASSPEGTVILRRLPPGGRLPRHRHGRSDVVHQVLAGRCRIDDGTVLAAPAVRYVPRGTACAFVVDGEEEAVLFSVTCPGVTRLVSKLYGSVFCPVCTAEIAIEEGDAPGDRVVCPDCGVWMRLVEHDKGFRSEMIVDV